jgi:sortase B
MNKKYVIAAVICLLIGVGLGAYAVLGSGLFGRAEAEQPPLVESATSSVEDTSAQEPEPEIEEEPEPEEEPYTSPIDFETLWAQNPDVIGWLDIPGTDITYPLLQRVGDDTYYLDHDIDGNKSSDGCLFTEAAYNQADFSDPVTLIYGHHMKSGAMFGNLQKIYSDADRFAEDNEIIIYLPDQELHYTIFAAVPYDNRHILYTYDCTEADQFLAFLNTITSVRAIGANFAEDLTVTEEDQLIVLSTCLSGNHNGRFLVLARLDTGISSPQESVNN